MHFSDNVPSYVRDMALTVFGNSNDVFIQFDDEYGIVEVFLNNKKKCFVIFLDIQPLRYGEWYG